MPTPTELMASTLLVRVSVRTESPIAATACDLQSLHMDRIALSNLSHGVLAVRHPLGSAGRTLTTLGIDDVMFTSLEMPCGSLINENWSAAEEWAFCRAVSTLSSLKDLALPRACWNLLTGPSTDPANGGARAPHLHGMDAVAPRARWPGGRAVPRRRTAPRRCLLYTSPSPRD